MSNERAWPGDDRSSSLFEDVVVAKIGTNGFSNEVSVHLHSLCFLETDHIAIQFSHNLGYNFSLGRVSEPSDIPVKKDDIHGKLT